MNRTGTRSLEYCSSCHPVILFRHGAAGCGRGLRRTRRNEDHAKPPRLRGPTRREGASRGWTHVPPTDSPRLKFSSAPSRDLRGFAFRRRRQSPFSAGSAAEFQWGQSPSLYPRIIPKPFLPTRGDTTRSSNSETIAPPFKRPWARRSLGLLPLARFHCHLDCVERRSRDHRQTSEASRLSPRTFF